MALKLIVDTLEGIPEAQQALYTKTTDGKFRLDVDGVEDVSGVKSALQKEREARSALEKKLKDYDGVDLEELRKLQTMVESSEDARLLKDAIGDKTKLDALRARWTDNAIKAKDKEIAKLQESSKTEIEKATQRGRRWETRVLDNALRDAATKAGLHASAVEDWLLHGRSQFQINDDGDPVQLDKDGKVVFGTKGPLTPTEVLDNLRDVKTHWWPASGNGGGSQQSSQSTGGSRKQMKRSAFDQLDAMSRKKAVTDGIQIVD